MAPKKDKKKEEDKDKAAGFTEVEKEFLVLQIADLNRKVARLRSAVEEFEARNDELQKAYDQLDEDRADIIAFLKKTLNAKSEENNELTEKVRGLEETRTIETAQFQEKVEELEKDFITMKDHLSSENKLLAGKLNTLEEFRAVRDDLMRKFETQEQEFKDQEEKYKTIIYEAEKKFITDKDKLKKEMEGRLLQLAQDFQDATELRIAASTHRVIRENIAINNELDNILLSQKKLSQINENLKEAETEARIAKELAEEEKDKAISKNLIQIKVIQKLTDALKKAKRKSTLYDKASFDFDELQSKIQNLTKQNEKLIEEINILHDNIKSMSIYQEQQFSEGAKVSEENTRLKKILKEAATAVRSALKLDKSVKADPTRDLMDRQALLSSLLEIVTQYREVQLTEATEGTLEMVYKEGDLGVLPKPSPRKSVVSARSSTSTKISVKPTGTRPSSMPALSIDSAKSFQFKDLTGMGTTEDVSFLESASVIDSRDEKESTIVKPSESSDDISSQVTKSVKIMEEIDIIESEEQAEDVKDCDDLEIKSEDGEQDVDPEQDEEISVDEELNEEQK